MEKFLILLEIFGIGMLFAAIMLLLAGDGAREQKLIVCFLCGSLVQNMGYLIELTAPTQEVAAMAVTVENFGSMFVPLCYCWFTYAYCYQKPPRLLLGVMGALNFAMLPVIFFNWNGVFYRHMDWLETEYGYHYLDIDYGPAYYPFLLVRIVLPYILTIRALQRALASRASDVLKRQYMTILGISILPVAALAAYLLKWSQVFDFTPVVLGLSISVVAIVLWSRRNYDFRHLAAEAVLNGMGDGVVSMDEQMRLVSYNRAAAEIFPRLASLRIGERVDALEEFQEERLREASPQKFVRGQRHYEHHAKCIEDENGRSQGYVVVTRDVTDTENYIREIKEVRRQAEAASVAKSEFLANMSHEIRTPMNAIIGLSDIVLEETRGLEVYTHVQDVQAAARNLLAIINDILDLSKVEAGKMELALSDYYLKNMVGEVVSMMDMAASQRGLLLKYAYDPSLPCAYHGDAGRIKQVLINLLNNAVKFTREGYVRLTVEGHPGPSAEEEVLIFRVEDTGCGIRKEDQDAVFEDFKQVDARKNRKIEGTGLGLPIVKRLVQLMEGTVTLQSEYGKGTVFTVSLPQRIVDRRPVSQVTKAPQEEETQEAFAAPGVRALLVDDNLVNRKVARGFLKAYQLNLDEAASGPEAIALVQKNRYDLIFMDHMMPEMDGIETVEILRRDCGENGRTPVVIALTANAMEGVREKFLACGFQDFIAKPLARKPLHELLLHWIPPERRESELTEDERQDGLDPKVFSIRGIDITAAMRYHDGDANSYVELLELYRMEGMRKCPLLRELAEKEDFAAYEVEVHGLKSASAHIGASTLSAMAREHEEAAHRGDYEMVRTHLTDLLAAYGGQLEEIDRFLTRWKAGESDGGRAPASVP